MLAWHLAVRQHDCIVVLGGTVQQSIDVVRVYNLYTEQWWKCTAEGSERTRMLNSSLSRGCCAVAVNEDIYVFGVPEGKMALWKLQRNTRGSLSWNEVPVDKSPSQRQCLAGWEYADKLFTFGGYGPPLGAMGHLNDFGDFLPALHGYVFNNQLLCFDPSCKAWSNLKCSGNIPSPRACSASAAATIDEKVYLYGGFRNNSRLGDLHQLDMESFTWTQVQRVQAVATPFETMVAITTKKVAFRESPSFKQNTRTATWILDLTSMSWREHTVTNDHFRFKSATVTGLTGSVITIGGAKSADSSYNQNYKSTFCIRLEPKSLQQLALITVYDHRATLPWKHLPLKLIRKIMGTGPEDNVDKTRII